MTEYSIGKCTICGKITALKDKRCKNCNADIEKFKSSSLGDINFGINLGDINFGDIFKEDK